MAEIPMTGPVMGTTGTAGEDHSRAESSHLKSAGTLANWAGAAVSVGLIIGIGIWGYKLLARDVSGVPVVKAVQGPMRIQPEDRGGRQAANQGLSVNSVAAEGMAAATADRLVLAPRAAELGATDQPQLVLETLAAEAENAAEIIAQEVVADTPQMASIQALAAQLSAGATTLGMQVENTYVAPEGQEEAVVTPVAVIVPDVTAVVVPELDKSAEPALVLGGMQRSLRPHLRPANLRTENITEVSAVAPQGPTDIDPSTIPAGTRLVQLGAFDSAEVAKSEWGRLNARFSTYLEGKSRVIQRAQSGGRTFYRLRAMGFEDIAAARRFCSALAAERADCIPVVTR